MAPATYTQLLSNRGFRALLWTQFLGAFHDNVYRFVVSMAAVSAAASASRDLSLVGAVFIAPFLFFSGYAGQVADRVDKRRVLVRVRGLALATTLVAVPVLFGGRLALMLIVLFLLAILATFFSPAKYGIVPELVPDEALSRANGLIEMSTFVAIVLGGGLGSLLQARWHDQPAVIGVVLAGVAAAGLWTSLGIPPGAGPAAGAPRISLNPIAGLDHGMRRLARDRSLLLTAAGIAYFWMLGALLQLVILLLGTRSMELGELRVALMSAWLAIGIATGSLAAGRLSGQKVELGLAPIGAFGMGTCALGLAAAVPSYTGVSILLALLGVSGGLFVVPLNALLQQRPSPADRGQVLATAGLGGTIGIMLASVVLWGLGSWLALGPERILLACGVVTILSSVYVLALVPEFFVRFTLWTLTHTVYRIRIDGQQHVPFRGPALLVSNHLSHVDGLLVGASLQRFVRFVVYRPIFEIPLLRPLFRLMHAIPLSASRHDVVDSLAQARRELEAGHVVCIFAEGAISRTGNLLPFKRGFERVVEGLDVPIIPVNLDRLWGSIFSFKQGRFFWKWPERLPFPVTVTFGSPMPASSTAADVRQAVMLLATEAMTHRVARHEVLHQRFFRTARRHWGQLAMAEAGRELRFGRALVASLLLSRWIRRHGGAKPMIGLVLPASIGGALANLATLIAGRVPVNLNFTAGREAMASAIAQCGIDTILTSRQFLARAKVEAAPGMVYLEDILPTFGKARALWTVVVARLAPARLLDRLYAPEADDADALATVIFSSGSTGAPKGVMLSHRNVLSNLEGMAQLFWVTPRDRIVGVLPFFHSFGFTGTLWFPAIAGFAALYVPNPLDAKGVGDIAGRHRATMIIGTPTFYTAYIRRCTREEFSALRYAIVGAEKLRDPIARAFQEKFGLEIIEGYGCTEMAPVISVNMPSAPIGQVGSKAGTVGHPLPGVAVRVVDPETGAPRGAGQEGLLLVKGPNLMLGYLHNPERTAEVVQDGWYVTGDIGVVDEDGFIRLTDRLSRFAKIAGEMVPHLKIEEVASTVLDDPNCAVTSIPDAERGERLVLFYMRPDVSPDTLWARLNESDLPKLWIPKRENIYRIDTIPLLGTGKVDLRQVRLLAQSTASTS